MTERADFEETFRDKGFCVVQEVLDTDFIERAKTELEAAVAKDAEYHGTTDYSDYGMVLLCSLYGGAFIDLFDNPGLMDPVDWILGDGSIVYAYTSSSLPPNGRNFSGRIHVDCPRIIPGYVTNVGLTIALDDFTAENGATWFLPCSTERHDPPDDSLFFSNAERFLVPAGSVCFFNARVWHASTENRTDEWRHALTINMCRPYMKQRIDIPRAMSHLDTSGLSERALQKLGFLAQTPSSYDEYYAPPEKRKYRQSAE